MANSPTSHCEYPTVGSSAHALKSPLSLPRCTTVRKAVPRPFTE
ncbi:MAG: hypothetical protein WAV90_23990 [Gordonia amarae]